MNLALPDSPFVCKACGDANLQAFYALGNAPVNSVVCISSREKALTFPRGDIKLVVCHDCGFVFNELFDPVKTAYGEEYESTQAYSPTFNRFHENLAAQLIERYHLYEKNILEIGCGQGEFLFLLAEKGNNHCIGYDPAYRGQEVNAPSKGSMRVIKDYFTGDNFSAAQIDFICCKMTLEHIPDVFEFMTSIRKSLDNSNATVFFQIPNFELILKTGAFQDVFYEHCSYFTAFSLRRLFGKTGFRVLNTWTGFDDQYLMIEALPGKPGGEKADKGDVNPVPMRSSAFKKSCRDQIEEWERRIESFKEKNEKTVVWGSSSKAVAFLTTVRNSDWINYVVDINPRRQGFYMAGTGQEIVAPDFLRGYQPDVIIIMNPVYFKEIRRMLMALDIDLSKIAFLNLGD